MHKLYFKRKK